MSRPRYLTDQDWNENIIGGVIRREPTIEFVRVREIGERDWSDQQILEYAAEHNYVVLSHDVKTASVQAYERLEAGLIMPGLILYSQTKPIHVAIEELLVIWSASDAEEWVGRIEFLPL